MNKRSTKLRVIGSLIALALLTSSTTFAISSQNQVKAHAQAFASNQKTSLNASVATNQGSISTQNAVTTQTSATSSQHSNQNTSSNNNNNHNAPQNIHAQQAQLNAQAHVNAVHLRVCQKHQAVISKIMNNITTRSQNQLNLFSTIATRVEVFYTKSGKSVSNYSQLIANISTSYNKATAAMVNVKNNSTFNCSVSHPHAMVNYFQSYLKTEISDLQSYRLAVKNLIVAVAAANNVKLSAVAHNSSSTGGN